MKKLIQSTVDALHYLYSGDADEENEVPMKEKTRGVILYSIVISLAIFMYWLLSQR
jgi:hypothetical protein